MNVLFELKNLKLRDSIEKLIFDKNKMGLTVLSCLLGLRNFIIAN